MKTTSPIFTSPMNAASPQRRQASAHSTMRAPARPRTLFARHLDDRSDSSATESDDDREEEFDMPSGTVSYIALFGRFSCTKQALQKF